MTSPYEYEYYEYTNEWGDLLTSYSGTNLTYDGVGNPLSYYNGASYTFTWSQGRRLATAVRGGNSLSFTYNDEGIRTSKTVNGVEHVYYLNGSQILAEEWGSNLIIYLYDAEGSPVGMQYRSSTYGTGIFDLFFFEHNLKGDIVAVYDASGNKLISYIYDAYGNVTTTYSNGGASSPARFNPFKYRGYYHDSELGFYYLNSRYYDPKVGRFVNADEIVSGSDGSLQGKNLFAYCFNNPVNLDDSNGNWPRWITAAVTVVAAVVTVAAVATGNFAAAEVAAKVTMAAGATYIAQSHHYDKRKAKNTNLPQTPQEADDLNWKNSNPKSDINPNGGGPAADCHQYTSPDKSNVKFVSPDGHREVIYNSTGNKVLDSRDIGTYNYSPSGTFFGSIGHFFADMLPWYLFGNDDDDPGPLVNEIIRLFE